MNARGIAWTRVVVPPVAGALSLILFWQWVVPALGVPAYIVPTPWATLRTIAVEWRFLLGNAVPTCIEAALGFLVGNAVGFMLAVAFTYGPRFRAAYFPVVLLFNTIPVLALAPIIILMFGLGLLPKVVIAAVVCFFPTLVNGVRGFGLATPSELELMRVLSAGGLEVFWRLRLPRAMPLLFASFRVASTTCVVGAIVGEWIGSNQGLGAVIIQATFNYQAERLFGAVILASLSGLAFYAAVTLVERLFSRLDPSRP